VSTPIRLQTHVWNPLGARRALLLHGLTSDGTCWWRLASDLADAGWLVIAPDLRSHGRSPTARDHTIATLAGDVALLGDGYDLVVGHSLGGAVAVPLLARPGFAAAAVLIDPVLAVADHDRDALRTRIRAGAGPLDLEQLRRSNPRWDVRDLHRKVLAAALVTPDVVDAVFADNDPWDLTALAAALDTPTHLLVADPALDGLLDPQLAARLATRPGITAEVVTGAGHSIHRDVPERVNAAIAAVLAAEAR
jgi:pimeloyl-ACP methyl ester carboxylesterase